MANILTCIIDRNRKAIATGQIVKMHYFYIGFGDNLLKHCHRCWQDKLNTDVTKQLKSITMATKNDKWSLFKNYLHNELGITKEDIRDWIDEAVRDEARKLVQQSFEKYSLRARIDDAIKDINLWGETNLKSAISKEVANRIFEKLEIKVK